jgi:hypothetical protein
MASKKGVVNNKKFVCYGYIIKKNLPHFLGLEKPGIVREFCQVFQVATMFWQRAQSASR